MRFRVMLYIEKQKHKFVREYNLMIILYRTRYPGILVVAVVSVRLYLR